MGVSDEQLEAWLPLWAHLDDTAAVAGLLWDNWAATHLQQVIADCLPGGLDDAVALYTWLAGIHDVGKCSCAFSVQVPSLAHEMTKAGLAVGDRVSGRELARHELVGLFVVDRWLQERFGYRDKESRQFSVIVGGHHGVPPEESQFAAIRGGWNDLVGGAAWSAVQDELLDRAAAATGAADRLPHWRSVRLTQTAQAALMSLVTMADWIASNDDFFPLSPLGQQPNLEPDAVARRARAGYRALSLPRRWEPPAPQRDAGALFRDRFPGVGDIRPVQAEACDMAWSMDPHGLMVIEAPMGEGKTEAALLAAEILAHRAGAAGVYIALPTQATSNAMFGRATSWVARLQAGDRTVSLAHGKAWLNDDFARLPARSYRATTVDQEEPDDANRTRGRADQPSRAIANRWLFGKNRTGLADFVVGTIDQVLFAALKSRYVDMRHVALIGKVVILDEVHAVDVYMNTYLLRVLEWLGAYGTPVILLSATLPPAQRAGLLAAYERGRTARTTGTRSTPVSRRRPVGIPGRTTPARPGSGDVPAAAKPAGASPSAAPAETDAHRAAGAGTLGTPRVTAAVALGGEGTTAPPMPDAESSTAARAVDARTAAAPEPLAYPLITATHPEQSGVRRRELEPSGRSSTVKLRALPDDLELLAALLCDRLADGGCAVVIRDTVTRVQQAADYLAGALADEGIEVEIAHARYLDIDRAERDQQLVEAYGPGATVENGQRPRKKVVVASQVVEQSLDVDFDLLVTDIAPVDLVIQRLGRLHRHSREARPPLLREPHAYITGFSMTPAGPQFGTGIIMVYQPHLLMMALAVLQPYLADGETLRLPADIAPLVAAAYAEQFPDAAELVPASWHQALRSASDKADKVAAGKEHRARTYRLGPVAEPGIPLLGWVKAGLGNVDDGPEGSKQVRDSGDSIEVIVAVKDNHGAITIPHWVHHPLAGAVVPTEQPIDAQIARVLARCALRLPFALCHPGIFDQTMVDLEKTWFAGWQASPHLRGELVLVLDEDLSATLAGRRVTYSPLAGLRVER